MKNKTDCIIIGGGHNGFTAAGYLAKAGKKVTILEKRNVLGGCSSTEELWDGFKISRTSYVISLFEPQIIKDLKLKENGLKILPRNPSSFTPDLNGPGLVLGHSAENNAKEIKRYNSNDAINYPLYESKLEKVAKTIETIISEIPPNLPINSKKMGLVEILKDLYKCGKLGKNALSLGDEIPFAVELMTGSTTPILERYFKSDILKATLATDAIIGAFISPSQTGSAYVLLHHVMGEAGGARGRWGYVEGGMGGLVDSLEKTCSDLGVEVFRNSPVKEIVVGNNKETRGVILDNGEFIEAKVVVSSLDSNLTFNHLVGMEHLPSGFYNNISNLDYSSASAKINLALDKLPNFCSMQDRDESCLNGTIHISPTMEYIEKAFDDAKYGHPSSNPILEMTIPSTIDKTLAPEGKHVMNIFVQYAPYKLNPIHGSWDNIKERFADRCCDIIEKYAPGFKDSILHREILSPLDLEREYGLTGGNIFHGAMNFSQMFSFRPVGGWADHKTPVDGLYMCGAATHPGGGVMGTCGKHAAEVILRDLK